MDNELLLTKMFFKSHHIPLSEDWLESCISWCKEETLNANYTQNDLQLKVYEQWLLLDLRNVSIPSLPPNLSQTKKLILQGSYSLQLVSLIDISKPKLWQLQKIRNSNVLTRATQQDSDIVGTGKRMLLVTLTDGAQEVEAIEYKPISKLNWNLSPGVKVQLNGPLTVRRGRLMLEEHNVKVLGGEVEELAVPFATENVLARFLNLPENPNPKLIEDNLLTVKDNISANGYNTVNNRQQNNFGNSRNFVNNHLNQTLNSNRTNQVNNRINSNFSTTPMNLGLLSTIITEEDELKIAEEVDMLLEAEESLLHRPSKKMRKSPNLFEEIDNKIVHSINSSTGSSVNNSNNMRPSTSNNNKNISATFKEDSMDVFEAIDIDEHLNKIDQQIQASSSSGKYNVLTIEKLLKNKPNVTKGVFKIKAKFMSIIQKLTMADGEFQMRIAVVDQTGNLIVNIHSDVISEIAEYCPSAMMSLKENILNKDKDAAATVMKVIQRVKDKIIKLDNIMTVKISKNEEIPVITSII